MVERQPTYTAGIDLGSASLGWSAVEVNNEVPRNLLRVGVMVFDPGVTNEKNAIQRGVDQSKNQDRRTARSARRRLSRRAARLNDLFVLLQSAELKLLPSTVPPRAGDNPSDPGQARQRTLDKLDRDLQEHWRERIKADTTSNWGKEHIADRLIYLLRSYGLDHRLEKDEFARVLMHIAQRRGFYANRSGDVAEANAEGAKQADSLRQPEPSRGAASAKEVKLGEVLRGIREIEKRMEETNSRTLGELFSRIDPREERIRGRWTSRVMYVKEFDLLWQQQATHYPELLDADLREKVKQTIFFQRKVTWDTATIGLCELEADPAQRSHYSAAERERLQRCPWSHPDAQRFRLVQRVNDLRVIPNYGALPQPLTEPQRETLKDLLQQHGDQTYAALRKALGSELPKHARFNFEPRTGRSAPPVRGNRTIATMLRFFGDEWGAFADAEREAIVDEWCNSHDERELAEFGKQHGLAGEDGLRWAQKTPEPGRCSLCLTAIRKVLPLMEKGLSYTEAGAELYPERQPRAVKFLPPVKKALPELRNPAVERALTQLRKLMNALVRQYGRPQSIRIELARELKKPRRVREAIYEQNNGAAERRRGAVERIYKVLQENGATRSRRDIEALIGKVLLWEECGGKCPYTGEELNFTSMILHGYYQIEHIFPKSRFPFDGFSNKTLAHPNANALKRNHTPWEAYHDTPEWEEIVERVSHFKGAWAEEKLRRFKMNSEEAAEFAKGFTERQLNDTAYASRLAADYVAMLYGGKVVNGKRVVSVSSGAITKSLRDGWALNAVLPAVAKRDEQVTAEEVLDSKPKNRGDHRHHAIDAVVIALTDEKAIKRLNDQAALNLGRWGKEIYSGLEEPWEGFRQQLKCDIKQLNVCHRPDHKLQGALHMETNYSPPRDDRGRRTPNGEFVHFRRPADDLLKELVKARNARDGEKKQAAILRSIVDPQIQKAVAAYVPVYERYATEYRVWRTSQRGKRKAQIDWTSAPRRPVLIDKSLPIRKIRVRERLSVQQIGSAPPRYVQLRNNHHLVVVAEVDKNDKDRTWRGYVVPLFDAMRELSKTPKRMRKGKTVPQIVPREFEYVAPLGEDGKRSGKVVILPRVTAEDQAKQRRVEIVRGRLRLEYRFHLMQKDVIELDVNPSELDGSRPDAPKSQLWVVRAFSQEGNGRLGLVRIHDAKEKDEMSAAEYWRPMVSELLKRNCKKVEIDLLGEKRYVGAENVSRSGIVRVRAVSAAD